eukprot:241366_1
MRHTSTTNHTEHANDDIYSSKEFLYRDYDFEPFVFQYNFELVDIPDDPDRWFFPKHGLIKKQSRWLKKWRDRYTVFGVCLENKKHILGEIVCYKTINDKNNEINETEIITLTTTSYVKINNSNNYQFIVIDGWSKQQFIFECESKIERDQWIQSLKQIIKCITE